MKVNINRKVKFVENNGTVKLSKKQQEILDAYVAKQIEEKKFEFLKATDAMILYSLHKNLGLGKKRLTDFFKTFINEYNNFVDEYDVEGNWLAAYRLKEQVGLDIDELHKELGL